MRTCTKTSKRQILNFDFNIIPNKVHWNFGLIKIYEIVQKIEGTDITKSIKGFEIQSY